MAGHAHPGECVGVAARRPRTPHWPGSRRARGCRWRCWRAARRRPRWRPRAGGWGCPRRPRMAVEELRSAGHALNRLLPAMSTACTDAQRGAIAARIAAALDRITGAAAGVRLTAPPAPAAAIW